MTVEATGGTEEREEGLDTQVVNKKWIAAAGEWEVEIADKKYPIKLSLAPLYDPKNLRIKS